MHGLLDKTEGRAPTAKQDARPEELTMDDIAICYKVLTDSDPDSIIEHNNDNLLYHPDLQRIHISRTTSALIKHAVSLAHLIEERRDQIIAEDAELVMRFCEGQTNYCPDRSELMGMLSQYGIVLRKLWREKAWAQKTYGGPEFETYFNSEDLGQRIISYINRIKRDADKMDIVRKIQFVEFSKSPLIFLVWTDVNDAKYIAYANKDWSPVLPREYAA